jgi:2-oxoglutarate ferredoxin oxidoreductase subunit alpha
MQESTAIHVEKSKMSQKAGVKIREHIIEIVSDSGEGAQTAGQAFGSISARMGNGVWTVEIIPAEIEPPARTPAGASGNRIRLGDHPITNAGDEANLVVAFNEQALLGREQSGNLKDDCIILLDNKWKDHFDETIKAQYAETLEYLSQKNYRIFEIPMEEECLKITDNPRRGKNMFVLGLLCSIYSRGLEHAYRQIYYAFRKKGQKVIDMNLALLDAGYTWAENNLDIKFEVPPIGETAPKIVVNGNIAVGLGVMASGMEVCAMYPITPATSASHYLSEVFEHAGGMVHQAEDEIAACAFAIGASYAGKCAVTITSGPGLAQFPW